MSNNSPNLYVIPQLPGLDNRVTRVMQDLADRFNYLTTELDRVRRMVISASPGVDAAKREHPIEGILTIPSGDSGGQDGAIRVSKDGVIVSYVNPIVDNIFPYVDLRTIGNVGVGLDDLHSFSLPAGSLARDGDYLLVWYGGDFAANNNNKQVVASFGGTNYEDTGSFDLDINVGWVMPVRISRLSPTSVLVSNHFAANVLFADSAGVVGTFGAGGAFIGRSTTITGLPNLNSNATTMLVQGEGISNNDVIQNLSIIDRIRPKQVVLV